MTNPHLIPTWQLKISYWYFSHKLQLKKIISAALVVLDVLLVIWFIGESYQFLSGRQEYLEQTALLKKNLVSLPSNQQNQPVTITWGEPQILANRNNKYDLLVTADNPNSQWEAYVTYQFFVNGQAQAERTLFLLPQESKYAWQLGVESAVNPEVTFRVKNLAWRRRVNAEQVIKERLNILISDISQTQESYGSSLTTTGLKFKVTNNSLYNYWRVGFLVLLGNGPEAVNYLSAEQLGSGESKTLETSWLMYLPANLSVKVIPDLDIFDSSVQYVPAQETGTLK